MRAGWTWPSHWICREMTYYEIRKETGGLPACLETRAGGWLKSQVVDGNKIAWWTVYEMLMPNFGWLIGTYRTYQEALAATVAHQSPEEVAA